MPYNETEKGLTRLHTLTVDNREKMSLFGVEDVKGFDENVVVLVTSQGDLTVRGEQLHIDKIDLEAGQLSLKGHIQEISYDEPDSGGLFSRLFG